MRVGRPRRARPNCDALATDGGCANDDGSLVEARAEAYDY